MSVFVLPGTIKSFAQNWLKLSLTYTNMCLHDQ